jgi:hypothetical protein
MTENEKTERPPRPPRWTGIGIDLLGAAGAGSLIYGCWLIYPPAGPIVGGIVAITAAILMARAG